MANDFHNQLTNLINQHSQENNSNTPDYILAKYVADCLISFDTAVNRREVFYGRVTAPKPAMSSGGPSESTEPAVPSIPIPEVSSVSSAMPVPKPKLPKPQKPQDKV